MDGGGTTVTVAGSWTQVSYTLNTQQWNTSLKAQIIMQAVNRNYDFDGTQI
jgi:triacylglycerol esterase/lipase EstA (alpha/beta hydrolase family)